MPNHYDTWNGSQAPGVLGKWLRCNVCGEECDDRHSLLDHKRSVHGVKMYDAEVRSPSPSSLGGAWV